MRTCASAYSHTRGVDARFHVLNPLRHTDDIRRLLLQTTFENIAIEGEIAQNEQFHLLFQYFQLFINIILSFFLDY